MTQIFFCIKKIFISYAGVIIFCLTSLYIVCLIPSVYMKANIGKTVEIFQEEGQYPVTGSTLRPIGLDNFTDSLMINTAYSVDSNSPLMSALVNARNVENIDQANQIENLKSNYEGKTVQKAGYERYWHGYLVYLRPLLVFFSYQEIRVILACVLYLLFLRFMYVVYKKTGLLNSLCFLVGFYFTDFFSLSKSMQFSSVYIVGFITSLILLTRNKKTHGNTALFFISGGLTGFFDLLTAPLVAMGIPLLSAAALNKKNNIFLQSSAWLIGYGMTWISKWIIVAALYSPDALKTALSVVTYRTFHRVDESFSHFKSLSLNFFQMIGYAKPNKITVLIAGVVLFIFLMKYFKITPRKNMRKWLYIAVIPYLWYLFAANHSYNHCWYTYRSQYMTVVSICVMYSRFIHWQSVKEDVKALSHIFGRHKSAHKNRS